MISLLEISLDVHVYTLLQCQQLLWATMGHMCKVNMCITSCKRLCSMGSWKSSFIIICGVGMKFNICRCALKPLNSSDSTSQLHLHQINCDSLIHKICYRWLDYVGNLDSSYGLKGFSRWCIISIILNSFLIFYCGEYISGVA